ncbi:MAG: hypothetical protein ABEJ64_03525 [Candidatus Nanohaloarchaea archaeon]
MMPSIINVLKDSFRLLRQQPRFFTPKLVSASVGAAWFIGLFSGTGPLYLYAATGPLLALLALFVSVMLAAMVEKKGSGSVLRKGFVEAGRKWRKILLSFLAFTLAAVVIYIPFLAGFVLYYTLGGAVFLAAGALLSLLLLSGFSFLSYFFPISLLQKGSVSGGFLDSASTALSNSREVVPLTLLSFALLGAASLTPDAGMKALGYAGFFAMRIVSAVATTYIFVVSPNYYLRS